MSADLCLHSHAVGISSTGILLASCIGALDNRSHDHATASVLKTVLLMRQQDSMSGFVMSGGGWKRLVSERRLRSGQSMQSTSRSCDRSWKQRRSSAMRMPCSCAAKWSSSRCDSCWGVNKHISVLLVLLFIGWAAVPLASAIRSTATCAALLVLQFIVTPTI